MPTAGTAAHAFTLLHDSEAAAFAARSTSSAPITTLLVDTYDTRRGIEAAMAVAGPELGAIRIDSGDLGVLAQQAREQLDSLGARQTRIVVSGDLDEFSIAGLAAAPVDVYGVGTSVVVGSGVPTAGLVYKLVEVDGRPVAKRSEHKAEHRWPQARLPPAPGLGHRHRGADRIRDGRLSNRQPSDRLLSIPLMRNGKPLARASSGRSPPAPPGGGHRAALGGVEAVPGEPGLPVSVR